MDDYEKRVNALIKGEEWLGQNIYDRENERKNQMTQKLNVVVAIIVFLAGSVFLLGKDVFNLLLSASGCIPFFVAVTTLASFDLVYFLVSTSRAFIATLRAMRSLSYSQMYTPKDFSNIHVQNKDVTSQEVEIRRSLAYDIAICGLRNRKLNENRSIIYNKALIHLRSAFFTALIFFVILLFVEMFLKIQSISPNNFHK